VWVRVFPDEMLADGSVRAVELADGWRAVLWRSGSGRLAACDARCPHQWSDLAVEGAVVGEELVCLAHHWRFDADGCGSKLGMTGRRDPKADVLAYATRVQDGWIEIERVG
jgi:phenylpropionate dioxygenase-like ring-hydroxylating dioxygenase large terminal subunit